MEMSDKLHTPAISLQLPSDSFKFHFHYNNQLPSGQTLRQPQQPLHSAYCARMQHPLTLPALSNTIYLVVHLCVMVVTLLTSYGNSEW